MTSLGLITFFLHRIADFSLEYNGVAGFSRTTYTLPFGWKVSPFIYHTTGLLATSFFRSISIPCLLYIDDRHNGQLQVSLDEIEYGSLARADERNLAAAKSAIFLVAIIW